MSIRLEDIKNPRLRAQIRDALAARLPVAQPQQAARPALDHAAQGKSAGRARVKVRIERRARRLLDSDNLSGAKCLLDQLRYQGCIRNDDPETITLELTQSKVKTKEEEGTLISITPELLK